MLSSCDPLTPLHEAALQAAETAENQRLKTRSMTVPELRSEDANISPLRHAEHTPINV